MCLDGIEPEETFLTSKEGNNIPTWIGSNNCTVVCFPMPDISIRGKDPVRFDQLLLHGHLNQLSLTVEVKDLHSFLWGRC